MTAAMVTFILVLVFLLVVYFLLLVLHFFGSCVCFCFPFLFLGPGVGLANYDLELFFMLCGVYFGKFIESHSYNFFLTRIGLL